LHDGTEVELDDPIAYTNDCKLGIADSAVVGELGRTK
jgi:hypothetical protein